MNDILDWIRVAKLYDVIADVLGMLVLGATYAQYNILVMFRKLLLWLETCLKVSSSIIDTCSGMPLSISDLNYAGEFSTTLYTCLTHNTLGTLIYV